MNLTYDHKLAIAIISFLIIIAGIAYIYSSSPLEVTDNNKAIYTCIFLCKSAKNQGMLMDSGPCLSSGSSAWELNDWVCDVAHWPRQDVDNLPQNQCPEYGSRASHFVEVSPECEFIRAV